MIRVVVSHDDDGTILAELEIERLGPRLGDVVVADYAARIAVDKVGCESFYQRSISRFQRKKYSVLQLVLAALLELTDEDMELDGDTDSPNMARKKRGISLALSRQASDSVRRHRPSLWSR